MKLILKRALPEWAYKVLRNAKWACVFFPYKLVLFFVKLLPDSFKIYIKSHLPIIRSLDSKGEHILINVDSDIEFTTRIYSCAKEPEMEEWFENYFKAGDAFYDIGANVGAYSLISAKLFKGDIKIYSI